MRLSPPFAAALVLLLVATLPVGAGSQAPPATVAVARADEPGPEPKGSADVAPSYAPNRVVVSWKEPAKAATGARGFDLQQVASVGSSGATVLATGDRQVEEVLAELRADPGVAWAEPDYLLTVADDVGVAAVTVNDPLTDQQYALDRMHVRDAWSIGTGGSNLIAILDTGVWAAHPELAGRLAAGYDFVNNDSNPADDNAHGTWVSGIIAANANDGQGIAGISWSDRIMPVKVMDENGTGMTSDLVAGIRWAVDHGASVINMSIGGYGDSQLLREAVDYAWARDVVLVAAAGNNRSAGPVFPASFPHVISVTATQADDEFTNWSNFGADVDVSAPGSSILTTNCDKAIVSACKYTGTHIVISGTSFSAPNVAGVVALVRARNYAWNNATVVSHVLATADDLGYPGWDNRYGHGRVNANRAMHGASSPITPSPGDALEPNNAFVGVKVVPIGTTFHPSIHPAGDVDYFAFDVTRAGLLDLAVAPVVDSVRLPKSSLPVDPVLHVYTAGGTLLYQIDNPNDPTAIERVSMQLGSAARIVLRVSNWLPNGNRDAYSVTSSFTDNVAPAVTGRSPGLNATRVPVDGAVAVTFSESVTGVSASSLQLRDAGGNAVPAALSYDAAAFRATLTPSAVLAAEAAYGLTLTSAIADQVGNPLSGQTWSFVTGKSDVRLAGADRYATAAAVSAAGFAPGVPVAYVATGANFPDALAAGPVAARNGGPILLVTRDAIPAATAAELSRLRPAAIMVLGGAGVVSDSVATALRGYATSGTVGRLAGADRYATAAAVSASRWPADGPAAVFVATGQNFADALAAVPLAGVMDVPLLLTAPGALSAATAAELRRLNPTQVIILGSSGAVSDLVRSQIRALWN